MNRREFSVGTTCLLAATAMGLPGMALAQLKKPESGTEYQVLEKRAAVEAPPGKIEVVEFFWYSCPHCNRFEPQLEAWIKKLPPDVAMRRVPVAFNASFEAQQRLYYTLEAMGKVDELHGKVFQAIHKEGQQLNKEDTILSWAEKQGLDKARFKDLFNSFMVASKIKRASQLQEAYRVPGVPALGVAGRYFTDGDLTGNMERALQVVDFLIGEARKAR
jgi:thiol:disulfide interchange protein DsbA